MAFTDQIPNWTAITRCSANRPTLCLSTNSLFAAGTCDQPSGLRQHLLT